MRNKQNLSKTNRNRISENESDKAIFALFDLLLKNKEEVEEINNSDDNHGETT